MKTIDAEVKGIIIPTGNFKLNTERYITALKYNWDKCDGNANFIVSGIGPDINSALDYSEEDGFQLKPDIENLDFHSNLWRALDVYTNQFEKPKFFGVDRNSVTSAENLLFCFPDAKTDSGKYAIVSYPLHLLRFKFLEKAMKLSGKLSKNITLDYVPTKNWSEQTKHEWGYGLCALGKELISFSFLKKRELK